MVPKRSCILESSGILTKCRCLALPHPPRFNSRGVPTPAAGEEKLPSDFNVQRSLGTAALVLDSPRHSLVYLLKNSLARISVFS